MMSLADKELAEWGGMTKADRMEADSQQVFYSMRYVLCEKCNAVIAPDDFRKYHSKECNGQLVEISHHEAAYRLMFFSVSRDWLVKVRKKFGIKESL